jgi:di/tricarboxylate transporter
MRVIPGGPLDGQAVGAGGLRSLTGVFLVQIDRGTESLAPVDPTAVLKGGDRLTFIGRADLVVDLQGTKGLVSVEAEHLARFDTVRHTFFEAVIGAASPLVGRTLKEAEFRGRYQAAVVAIHRAGHRVNEKLGAVKLQVGDTLLLLTDAGFRDRWRDRNDFLLVSRLGGSPPSVTRKAGVAGAIALIVVLLIATGLLPTLKASLLGAIALVGLGALTPSEARSAVNFDVIILIAGSFGLAAAIEHSGLASTLADGLISALHPLGPRGVLASVVVATVLANGFITNNATAVLIFPFGMSAAHALQTDPRPFAIAICIAASASFLTPVGYQCNMMVYGPGGYRFGDYARLGAPLAFTVIAVTVMLVPVFWPF